MVCPPPSYLGGRRPGHPAKWREAKKPEGPIGWFGREVPRSAWLRSLLTHSIERYVPLGNRGRVVMVAAKGPLVARGNE